jgi:hypothetical protein
VEKHQTNERGSKHTTPKGHKPELLSVPESVTGMDTAPADSGEGKEANMKVKFSAIVGSDAALKAVERDGYALKYVLDRKLFTAIAAKFGIEIEK